MTRPSDWLTAVRTRRLGALLIAFPRIGSTPTEHELTRILWRIAGGPLDEVPDLFNAMLQIQVVSSGPTPRRTSIGTSIASALQRGDSRPLGRALVRSGMFHDQARRLLEASSRRGDGTMTCPSRAATGLARQLVGLIRWWPDSIERGLLVIPRDLVSEFISVWALNPPADAPWLDDRKAVGERAERYSVQYETDLIDDPSRLLWVSRDSDLLGWDIEDHSVTPFRAIEVKGGRGSEPVFFVSENELNRARDLGPRYEVQFWGDIDLARDPAEEFAHLRNIGYPILIPDFAAAIDRGDWTASPSRWRVTRPNTTAAATSTGPA